MCPEALSPVQIVPLASDSMGVRSMSIFVKTPDISVLIDPGVALGPWRYGLPPHRREIERLGSLWHEIEKRLSQAEAVFITHYHYDHLNPQEPELFINKRIFLKEISDTNRSQMKRGRRLIEKLESYGIRYEFADERTFRFGETTVFFSPSFPHGKDRKRGTVIMVVLKHGNFSFLFSSDIEGIPREDQLDFLLRDRVNIMYLDGPPTYLLGDLYPESEFRESLEHMSVLIEENPARTLIIDHHLLRDRFWKEKVSILEELGQKNGVEVKTAANFLGKKEELLEATRKALYYQKF